MGQRLQAAGLHTAYVGKWHLEGHDYYGTGVCPEGWDPDYWFDILNHIREFPSDQQPKMRRPNFNRDPDFTENHCFAKRCADRAVDFLREHGSEDFCLVVSIDEPHDPALVPPEWDEKFAGVCWPKSPNIWDTLEEKPRLQRLMSETLREEDRDALRLDWTRHLAAIAYMDDQVGRVLKELESVAPDALVIFTSDHGAGMQSHCIGPKGPVMYDEVTRVPLLWKWPDELPEGRVIEHPVSHIDILPTLLNAVGAEQPEPLAGQSLLPVLRDADREPDSPVFIEFNRFAIDNDGKGGFQPVRCVVHDNLKLVINLLDEDELYDLSHDPYEMHNAINDPALSKRRDRLHTLLLEWMNETLDLLRGYQWRERPWAPPADTTWNGTGGGGRRKGLEAGDPPLLGYLSAKPLPLNRKKPGNKSK